MSISHHEQWTVNHVAVFELRIMTLRACGIKEVRHSLCSGKCGPGSEATRGNTRQRQEQDSSRTPFECGMLSSNGVCKDDELNVERMLEEVLMCL